VPIYPYPILNLESSSGERYLIVSDVHIGWEDKLRAAGLIVDFSDSVVEMAKVLLDAQKKTGISNLIILGDLKSSTSVITKSEWTNVPRFINTLEKSFKIFIIPGNHDGKLSYLLPFYPNLLLPSGLRIDNVLLFHGHTRPRITSDITRIIIGHLHPVLKREGSILNGSKVWVKLVLSKIISKYSENPDERKIEVIILPHFNELMDYYSKSSKIKVGLTNKSKLPFLDALIYKQHWNLLDGFMFSTDGTLVGNLQDVIALLYGT
jgi:putative SbcD/Mre11-related phosphoesterase